MEATALGTEVEFLAGRLVFGPDTVGDYAYDACSGFDSSAHKCLFRFAYERRHKDSLRSYGFFPCGFVVLSLGSRISAADYSRRYHRMLQQLEIAVEVHFFVKDSDSMGAVEEFGMGQYGQSPAGIVRNVVGESFGHCLIEGDLVVEFWSKEGGR